MDAVHKVRPTLWSVSVFHAVPPFMVKTAGLCAVHFCTVCGDSWPDGGRSPACVFGLIRKVEGLQWSKLPNLPVTLTISLLPSKADAVYWGKTLVFQREDRHDLKLFGPRTRWRVPRESSWQCGDQVDNKNGQIAHRRIVAGRKS